MVIPFTRETVDERIDLIRIDKLELIRGRMSGSTNQGLDLHQHSKKSWETGKDSRLHDNGYTLLMKMRPRDGLKVCRNCNESCGLRTLKCPKCSTAFKRKEKNWEAISLHASTMKDSYIKEKLFERMDQLATKPGWTGILFLVHDSDPEGTKGRVHTHSYSTKGTGEQIEAALKNGLFKTMKKYLFGAIAEDSSNEKDLDSSSPNSSGPNPSSQLANINPSSLEPVPDNLSSVTVELSKSPEKVPDAVEEACALQSSTSNNSIAVSSDSSSLVFGHGFNQSSSTLTPPTLTSSMCSVSANSLAVAVPNSICSTAISTPFFNSSPSSSAVLLSVPTVSEVPCSHSTASTGSSSGRQGKQSLTGRVVVIGGQKFFVLKAP